MEDQSRRIIPDTQKNKQNTSIDNKQECNANTSDKQNDPASSSVATYEKFIDEEEIMNKVNEEVVNHNDNNDKIVNNDSNKEIVNNDSNKEIVNNDISEEIAINDITEENVNNVINEEIVNNDIYKETVNNDNMTNDNINGNIDVTIENFVYSDENKIYKQCNLQKTLKLKTTNLNEDELCQDLQQFHQRKLKSNIHTCDLYPKTFNSKYLLSCHKLTHGNLFTCFHCQKVYDKNIDLVEHKKLHENEMCFICGTCEMAFSSEITYLRHTYSHSKPPYKCKECLFTTKEIKSIKAHVLMHSVHKIKCDLCNQMVYARKMLYHRSTHNNIECGECGKIIKTKTYFDYHMISHTGVKKEQCLYCGKGFANRSQLKVHTIIHTGVRSYECNVCLMRFKQNTDLKRHSVVHIGKRFECDYCGKKFLHKESIQFHLRLHTNYKPYKCPECPMTFVTSAHLTNHTYRWHMDRFSCDACKKILCTKKDYTRHLKSKSHRNKMFGYNLKGN